MQLVWVQMCIRDRYIVAAGFYFIMTFTLGRIISVSYTHLDVYKRQDISDYIYNNPELGNEEYKAVEALTTFLKEHDFKVEASIAGMDTAFKATFDSGKPGMTIGYLCEYDALPKIGHGCGHNMIGVMSAGAGVVLSKVLHEIGGKVIVYGTPAEETNGSVYKRQDPTYSSTI